jgi:hypothetical protein
MLKKNMPKLNSFEKMYIKLFKIPYLNDKIKYFENSLQFQQNAFSYFKIRDRLNSAHLQLETTSLQYSWVLGQLK